MKKILRLIVIMFVLLLIIVLFSGFGKKYLIVDEEPKKSDVIIVLSGGPGRLYKAAELYKKGYSDYVLLSRAYVDGLYPEVAQNLGIPINNLIFDENATSTYTSAVYSKNLMEIYEFNSAIVVSNDYHMRRTKLSFDRVFSNTGVEITYVATKSLNDYWFLNKVEFKRIFTEWIKLVGYYFKFYKFLDL
ncbi:YdcF family protein [Neobacillus citreus]|uniref:YdcF family protein n=1 Tax=Neobacillus citreus TaxID=2833578 RepID=A0A942T3L9_9BACI|nr:YdcF family protein [Neobacillus citreus]MCH6266013.1 YdcF family protein [Neobacillus citreus]